MKMLNSWGPAALRVEQKSNFFPSRLNIGKLSKRAPKLTRSVPVPSVSTTYSENVRFWGSCMFDE